MNQCVPSSDLDENPTPPRLNAHAHSNSSNSFAPDVPSLDCEVAELIWENGQPAMHGLGLSRVAKKPAAAAAASSSPAKYAAWDKLRAGGTLESIVNQATGHPHPKSTTNGGGNHANELVPWFDHHHALVNPAASASMTMDALVPCNNNIRRNSNQENSTKHVLESVPGISTCMVGSCSGAATGAAMGGGVRGGRLGPCCCRSNASVSESATCGGRDSHQVTLDSCDREFGGGGLTSTSLWSPENTSSGKEYTRTSGDDHDSICHSGSQRGAGDKGKRKGSTGKSSISAKSRAAAIHNQSERKRRDKINQRMKTLQKLVPNSSKTDKASMLDEVIEYLKQLQAQVQMMSRMNMATMMLPLPMQQQLQISMMAPAMGMGMGLMDINTIGRATALPPIIPAAAATAAFMPVASSWDIQPSDRLHVQPFMPDLLTAFLACQSQPMTIDAYSRLAALSQQFQQPPPGSGSKS